YCQEQYRVAVENYLETYMNYFVVEGLKEALEALQLLNDSAKGKAGFFILSRVEAVSEDLPVVNDQLIPALTIIDVESKYLKLCQQLLKNVYFYRRSEEHTSELQSRENLVCRLLLEKKKTTYTKL